MTDEQYVTAKILWARGTSKKRIAHEIGVSDDALASAIHRHREDFPYRKRHLTDEQKRRIRELRAQGMTRRAVAAIVGVHRNTVLRVDKERSR